VRLFWLLFTLGIALFLQVTLLNFFPVFGVKPDLVLIFVVFNAFLKGSRHGAMVGFLGGLMEDLAVGSYIGMNALVLMAAGYLVGLAESKLYKDSSFIVLVLVWLSAMFTQIFTYIMLSFMGVYISLGIALFRVALPSATYTAVLVLFFYRRFFRSNQEGLLYDRRI